MYVLFDVECSQIHLTRRLDVMDPLALSPLASRRRQPLEADEFDKSDCRHNDNIQYSRAVCMCSVDTEVNLGTMIERPGV
jgi:hypothetical protein